MEININVSEAIRYMGYREQPPAPQMEMIESCRRELVKAITPAWVYRAFDIEECDDGIKLAGTKLIFKGEDIRRHLSGCRRCILPMYSLIAAVYQIKAQRFGSAAVSDL